MNEVCEVHRSITGHYGFMYPDKKRYQVPTKYLKPLPPGGYKVAILSGYTAFLLETDLGKTVVWREND